MAASGREEAIYRLYRAGIVWGVNAARECNPSANIKRSEVAAILTRMMDSSARVRFAESDSHEVAVPS
jgi:hypothetical protein